MARNETYVDAPVEDVFELLADPRTYGVWVVGSREIRAADEDWPAPGTRFEHTVGIPPLLINDETVVVSSRPPGRLQLRVGARPLPPALVTVDLEPEDGGTRVTMIENLASGLLNIAAGPLTHAVIRMRNREALRRLKALAEGAMPRPRAPLARRQAPSHA